MAVLSREQIVGLCAQVGLGRGQIPIAGAICDAESGRRTDAVGVNPGTNFTPQTRDRGLWQINNFWHPDVTDACAFNALCNAQAMARISGHGASWTPWSTYNSGAYRAFLPAYEILVGGQVYTPPPAYDPVRDLQTMVLGGWPVWKAVLTVWERLITQIRQAVYHEPAGSTDLGSRFF